MRSPAGQRLSRQPRTTPRPRQSQRRRVPGPLAKVMSSQIHIVRIDDDVIVKRLLHDATVGWLLQSDNPNKQAWPTQPFPDDARVVGEVKWTARSFV